MNQQLIERARELLNNTEDIEAQNLFSSAKSLLINELHISLAHAQKIIYHIEETDNRHWLRKNDYSSEFTNWMRDNNCYCKQTEDSNKWRSLYYKWLKLTGRHILNYNKPNIGKKVYEIYGVKIGHRDYNKYYSKLYKQYLKSLK